MKKLLFPIILPMLFLVTTLNSCGVGEQTKAAELVAEEFYESLSEKDYDKAMSLVDEDSKKITPEDEWLKILTQKEEFGKFEGFKKDVGFNMNTSNGVTTVKLNYTCDYESFTLYERFIMIKRGDDYKVRTYEYNTEKSLLSE